MLKGFDADDKPVFENAKRAPTARELMTHTAGYVYEFWNADSLKAAQMGISPSLLNGGNYLAAPLAFQPGTAWEYGINTDWLGVPGRISASAWRISRKTSSPIRHERLTNCLQ